MNRTKIEYGTHAWNPVTGCSYGCPWGCWAETCFSRWEAIRKQHGHELFAHPMIHPDRLDEPMNLKKPARILVSFMGDLFATNDEITEEFRRDVFHAMDNARHHQFFLLTKRANIMRLVAQDHAPSGDYPHVFFGVTVTTQAEADERIPLLLATPAVRRWVSIEPMLGPVDLKSYVHRWPLSDKYQPSLDFVVVGSIDRPSPQFPAPRREWIESIREQCKAAGVPLWEKNNLARHGIVKDRPLIQELPS